MKVMAAFTLIFALIALVLTGIFVLAKWDSTPGINELWKYVSFWPATFIDTLLKVFNNPASFLKLGTFVYVTLFVQVGAVITTVMMARALDRAAWDWAIATFIFPYAAPFFLVFLKER
jgi:hypothetical protein